MKLSDYIELQKWAESMRGVFTLADLKVLYGDISDIGLYKKLNRMVEEKQLIKVKRGLYALPSASLTDICMRMEPNAYISTGTVLASHLMIGSIPGRRIQAVKTGAPRAYECELGTIELLSMAPHLFFGYSEENGLRVATPEKAWLDTCYYAYKGRAFSFDLDTDVDKDALDEQVLTTYLDAYDRRFQQWYHRNWRSS
ncbi:MAG: hypothetical protein EOL87_17780 [Spartobacteria bacterium]|nr:hypothetical protein [Spartobacteria bacterium]